MNLPNSITLGRLVLTAIFVVAASIGGIAWYIIGLVAFILAAISDWLDGYLARKMELVTTLGKLLDPLADKILVASAFVFFSAKGLCPVWVTALIIGRELLVTGLRQIAVEKGVVMAADNLGKWKTTFQLAFGITCMVWLIFDPTAPHKNLGWLLHWLSNPEHFLFPIFLWGSLVLTLLSGLNYLKESRNLLLD
ncbi:MAG: CDP-diacylglycerol--glycerol-3-phosphate 3-phosphatidyltransferase [Akkermansiaceae bacterium]